MKKIISFLLCAAILLSLSSVKSAAVSAKAAVLINVDSGEVLYAKNDRMRLSMASTTKIMTALILCETADLNESVTVTNDALSEGSSMGLSVGDTITYRDLLYGMMLSSGNDAANATAISIGGSIEKFVSLMNERAAQMGLCDTNFQTPSGLDGEKHYTTATDLCLLTVNALKNPIFKRAVSTKSITISYGTPQKKHTLVNHNRLIREYDCFIGVKTGFTKKSGRCLVSAAQKDDKYLVCVTLNDPNDWQDHKKLMDDGFSALKNTETKDTQMRYVALSCGGNAAVKIEKLSLKTQNQGEITVKTDLPQILYPPLLKTEKVGTAYYYFEHRLVKRISLYPEKDIKNSEKTNIWLMIKIILSDI